MPNVIELGTSEFNSLVVDGGGAVERLGWSVAGAGDVNGDGIDDFIFSGIFGPVYVIFGRTGGFDDLDFANLQPSDGFVFDSNFSDFAAYSVSAAGDVNGDGFDDIIASGFYYNFGSAYYPTAYVIYGAGTAPGDIDLSDLGPAEGFRISSDGEGGYDQFSIASAGDVNGDGFDDLLIGSPYDGDGAGTVYLLFGKAGGIGDVDLDQLAAGAGIRITGEVDSYDFAGLSVAGAGDVNGDGFDDIVIGAPYAGYYGGEAYLIFGRATGFGDIDLANLAPESGFVIQGAETYDSAGFSVAGAGDFNGDGFDDIVIGAHYADNAGGIHAGEAYVIFGRASGFGTIDLGNLEPGTGFTIIGDDTGDHAGWSVSSAGDVNNDGFDDIIIGAPRNDLTRNGERVIDAGESYVIFGRATGFGMIDLTNLSAADGFILQGEAEYDYAGFSVAGAGDVDGDGFDDIIIGAPTRGPGNDQVGAVYVVSGRTSSNSDGDAQDGDFNGDGRADALWRHDSGVLMQWLGQADGSFVASPDTYAISADWTVVGIGDFDGDNRGDILWRHDSGVVMQWRNFASEGFVASHATYAMPTDWSVVATGDFNGDGRDDVAWRHDSGVFYEWMGQANGSFAASAASYAMPTDWSVAGTSDFNGDGRDDILWRHDSGTFYQWLGQANGSFAASAAVYTMPTSWSVAGTGDFNGDGRGDILWLHDSGSFFQWLGQAGGGFAASAAEYAMPTDWTVDTTGDFNGDGRDDILWRHDGGTVQQWLGQTNGSFIASEATYDMPPDWQIQPQDVWG